MKICLNNIVNEMCCKLCRFLLTFSNWKRKNVKIFPSFVRLNEFGERFFLISVLFNVVYRVLNVFLFAHHCLLNNSKCFLYNFFHVWVEKTQVNALKLCYLNNELSHYCLSMWHQKRKGTHSLNGIVECKRIVIMLTRRTLKIN